MADLVDSVDGQDEENNEQAKHDRRVDGGRLQLPMHAVVTEQGCARGHDAGQNRCCLHKGTAIVSCVRSGS